jgi:pimeloyl-ACP methyl ester carboxylesterase
MSYKVRFITSADGAEIHYREWGAGPGLVLVHGGMQAAQNFSKLAEALGDSFTVFVPDRRGRGRSGAFGEGYGLSIEREDLHALLRATGARRVFGLSSTRRERSRRSSSSRSTSRP